MYSSHRDIYLLPQRVCDNNMVFTDVLAGWPGSVHDSRVLRNSELFHTAVNKFPSFKRRRELCGLLQPFMPDSCSCTGTIVLRWSPGDPISHPLLSLYLR